MGTFYSMMPIIIVFIGFYFLAIKPLRKKYKVTPYYRVTPYNDEEFTSYRNRVFPLNKDYYYPIDDQHK